MAKNGRCALRALLLASVSLAGLVDPAWAGVVDYPDGSTNSSTITLTDNSTQLQVLTGSATQSGSITQSGGAHSLEKIGAGTLIFTGTKSYTGTTTISAGTLQLGDSTHNGTLINSTVNNATLSIYVNSGLVTAPGFVSGSGTFIKNGSGLLTASGNITASQVMVSSGALATSGIITASQVTLNTGTTLFIGTGSNGGGIVLADIINNGTLYFSRAQLGPVPFTYAYSLSGAGGNIVGSGDWVFTGANTFSGTLEIENSNLYVGGWTGDGGTGGTTGTLGTGDIVMNDTTHGLIFFRSDALSYGGAISGSGLLTQAGGGTLTLSGTSTYTGATTVSAGTLMVDGSIAASSGVTVQNGATLGGKGTVGPVVVQSGGTLAPGETSKLTVNGNLSLASGTATALLFSSSSQDQIAASGTAGIDGALFVNFATGQTYTAGQYALITSSGLLSGTFASFNTLGSPSGFTTTLSYDSHDVFLNLARSVFTWGANPGSSDWSTGSNWTPGIAPTATDTAIFQATTRATVTVSQAAVAKSLEFDSGAPAYTIAIAGSAGGAASLTLATGGIVDTSGNAPAITVSGVSGNTGTLAFYGNGNAADANITAGAFGTVSFNGLTDPGAAAKLTAQAGGAIDFSASSGANGDNKVTAGSIAGAGNILLGANSLTVGGLNTSTEFDGVISGTGGLTKAGFGTLTLGGTNTYTGGTTVSTGVLNLGTSTATAKIAGAVTLNGTELTVPTLNVNFADVSGITGITNNTGLVQFNNASNAGGMTLVNAGPAGGSASFYYVTAFSNTSSAGTATINTGNDGGVFLQDTATLGIAKVTNTGILSTTSIQAAALVLRSSTPLTTPVIVNNTAGITFAQNNSNLGQASITNNANGLLLVATGQSTGVTAPSAGSAIITNNNGGITSFSLPGGHNAVTFGMLLVGSDIDVSNDSGTAASATITNNSGGATYFFSKTSGGAATIINNAGGVLDISGLTNDGMTLGSLSGAGDVFLGANTLTLTGNDNATVSGIIASAGGIAGGTGGGLVKTNSGLLTLSGANTYTGGTTILAGLINFASLGSFGTGAITINGGGLQWASGNTADVSGRLSALGTNGAALDTNGNNVTLASAISGAGVLAKQGGGILTLTASSTYTGATNVSGGMLQVDGSIAASSGVTVASGATLAGSGTVAAATVQSGGAISPGAAAGGTGTLAVTGDLTLAAGSAYGAEISASSADKITATGAASIAGNLFANFSSYAVGSPYTILTSTGALTGTFASLNTLGLAGSGYHATASYDSHDVFLTVVRDTFIWSATPGSGDWNTATNWQTSVVPTSIDPVFFNATSNANVTIGAAANAQSLQFNAGAPAYSFAIAGTSSSAASLTLSNGITDNSGNAPTFTVGGVSGHGGTLAFTGGGTAADAVLVAGGFGTISFAGNTDAGAAAKLTAQSGGVIDFSASNGVNADNKVAAGSITGAGSIVLGADTLSVGALGASTEFSGVISGTGGLVKLGTGTLTLSGTNAYTGGTSVSAGTLQLGNGGTSGSLAGNVADNGALAFNRSDSVTFAGVVSGNGSVAQKGTGTLTLSGTNTYTGGTSINAGTLNVTGAIGSLTAAGGTTLTGTGKVGATSIASSATLAPGAGASLGTLTVQGNLSLASGSSYVDYVTPSATSLTTITSTGSLNGAFTANVAAGTYTPGQRYTLVTAAGGLSGTFASLTATGLSTALKARLGYDANDAYLYLDANAITPLLPAGATVIETNLAAGIDKAVQGGATLNSSFTALFNLSGAGLTAALDQIAGNIGGDIGQTGSESFAPFLALLMDQDDDAAGLAGNYAPGYAYGTADAPKPARLAPGEVGIWGSVYGSHGNLSADPVSGASALSAGAAGFAAGVERQMADDATAGLSIGVGRNTFSSGNGKGSSDDIMLAAYGRYAPGRGYLSGAIGYGWHDLTITRTVTVAGTDVLAGKPEAHEWAGRVEAGYGFDLGAQYRLTPFAAFEGESASVPGYTETAVSGSANFALSYAAHSGDIAHLELGSRLGRISWKTMPRPRRHSPVCRAQPSPSMASNPLTNRRCWGWTWKCSPDPVSATA